MVQRYTPHWFRRELALGDTGDDVAVVQRKIGAPVTGVFDEETEARTRGVQVAKRIKPTGKVDKQTAAAIGEESTAGLVPRWFDGEQQLWTQGPAVRCARKRLGFTDNDDRFDPDTEAAVRRFQSANRLAVTGRVDETTATLLGDCACN